MIGQSPIFRSANPSPSFQFVSIVGANFVFHIKICGVRFKEDIIAVGDSAADAIGLNFYPQSVRFLDPQAASTRELSDQARSLGLVRVGVFVNRSPQQVIAIADQVGLEIVQLHGDETTDDALTIVHHGWPVLRAIKLPVGPLSVAEIDRRAKPWQQAGIALLLDADAGATHGGSGQTLDWATLKQWAVSQNDCTWVLAGGLHPDNVAAAIRASGAVRVDVASGVESARGIKADHKIIRFAKTARAQWEHTAEPRNES